MDFPTIIANRAHVKILRQLFFLLKRYALVWKKQTNMYEEKSVILQ